MGKKEGANNFTTEDIIRETLKGCVGELLGIAASSSSPENAARKLIEYNRLVMLRMPDLMVIFRDGWRLCDNRFPISENQLNKYVRSKTSDLIKKFDGAKIGTLIYKQTNELSGSVKRLVGSDVLKFFNARECAIASVLWYDSKAVAAIAAFAKSGEKMIEEELLYLRHAAAALSYSMRSLMHDYFGIKFNQQLVGLRNPFIEGRKRIAVLFCDIRNFTPFVSLFRGREEVTDGLQLYFKKATACIHKNGGMLDKFIGDGIMALFGVADDSGTSFSESVQKACEAAVEIQKEFREIRKNYFEKILEERSEFIELSVGAGVDAGESLLGFFGRQNTRSYSAIGDCVNTAARLESLAGKDSEYATDSSNKLPTILVGASAFRNLSNSYQTQRFRKDPYILKVKGKSLPIKAHGFKS